MRINWTGLVLFVVFCLMLGLALSRPGWIGVAEGGATILILLALGRLSHSTSEERPEFVKSRITKLPKQPQQNARAVEADDRKPNLTAADVQQIEDEMLAGAEATLRNKTVRVRD